MTLHVILGDGEMPTKEIKETLEDLKKRDQEVDAPCWFLIQGKDEPTATDKAVVSWLATNDIWYEIITDGSYDKKVYTEPQATHKATRLAPKVVELMASLPEEGETSHLLGVWVSESFDDEKDRWLNDVGAAVQEAGHKVLAFNDGLLEVDMSDEDTPEPEPEATPAPSKIKSKMKSAEEAPAAKSAASGHTREELEEMDLPGLKAVAANLGISLPPRTRMGTYIDAILGEGGPGEVEAEDLVVDAAAEVEPSPEDTPITKEYTDINANGSMLMSPSLVVVHHNGSVLAWTLTAQAAQDLVKSLSDG